MSVRLGPHEKHCCEDLVSTVARTFFDDEHVIVLDALLRFKWQMVSEEELATSLKLPMKRVRNVLLELSTHCLTGSHHEPRVQRTTAMTYWYIDYKNLVDSLKYRFHKMKQSTETSASGDFFCISCDRKFEPFDMQRLYNHTTKLVECEHCHMELVPAPANEAAPSHSTDHIREQIKPLETKLHAINFPLPASYPKKVLAVKGAGPVGIREDLQAMTQKHFGREVEYEQAEQVVEIEETAPEAESEAESDDAAQTTKGQEWMQKFFGVGPLAKKTEEEEEDEDEYEDDEDGEEEMITVGGETMALSAVDDEVQARMTEEEYLRYAAMLSQPDA